MNRETKIRDAGLSVRLRNICIRHGIDTIGQLMDTDTRKLMSFRNFGRGTLAEVDKIRILCEDTALKTSLCFTYNDFESILQRTKDETLVSQWHDARVDIPYMNGDSSDLVLVKLADGSFSTAVYDRYREWKKGETIMNVTNWMPIPNVK